MYPSSRVFKFLSVLAVLVLNISQPVEKAYGAEQPPTRQQLKQWEAEAVDVISVKQPDGSVLLPIYNGGNYIAAYMKCAAPTYVGAETLCEFALDTSIRDTRAITISVWTTVGIVPEFVLRGETIARRYLRFESQANNLIYLRYQLESEFPTTSIIATVRTSTFVYPLLRVAISRDALAPKQELVSFTPSITQTKFEISYTTASTQVAITVYAGNPETSQNQFDITDWTAFEVRGLGQFVRLDGGLRGWKIVTPCTSVIEYEVPARCGTQGVGQLWTRGSTIHMPVVAVRGK